MYCKLKIIRNRDMTVLKFLFLSLMIIASLQFSLSCSSTDASRYEDPAKAEIAKGEELKMLARGKDIWMDPKTGTNGFSCEDCHENGELTNAEQYPRYKHIIRTMATLSITHNFAVVNESKGKPWEIGNYDANALVLYVKFLANGKSMRISEPLTYSKNWINRGKTFFNDPNLGTINLSCASCHEQKNKNLLAAPGRISSNLKGVAAVYPRYSFEQGKVITLEQQVNYCIEKRISLFVRPFV